MPYGKPKSRKKGHQGLWRQKWRFLCNFARCILIRQSSPVWMSVSHTLYVQMKARKEGTLKCTSTSSNTSAKTFASTIVGTRMISSTESIYFSNSVRVVPLLRGITVTSLSSFTFLLGTTASLLQLDSLVVCKGALRWFIWSRVTGKETKMVEIDEKLWPFPTGKNIRSCVQTICASR